MLGANTDKNSLQLFGPNTQPASNILQNSYVSELDLEQISKKLDIEMAVMLDPHEATKATSTTLA